MEKFVNVKARVFDIYYDITEEDLEEYDDMSEEEFRETIPSDFVVEVCCHTDKEDPTKPDTFDLEAMLVDQISYETGWYVDSFNYEILDVWEDEE